MSPIVVITGAAGNIGRKLRLHFEELGWELRLVGENPDHDPQIDAADLAVSAENWSRLFRGADAVVHLAATASQFAGPELIWRNNVVATENVLRAALESHVKRVVFASSSFVMVGYRFSSERLTTGIPPKPLTAYRHSKLLGERLGASAAGQGLSFIALRIGYCQPGDKPRAAYGHGTMGPAHVAVQSRFVSRDGMRGDMYKRQIRIAQSDER